MEGTQRNLKESVCLLVATNGCTNTPIVRLVSDLVDVTIFCFFPTPTKECFAGVGKITATRILGPRSLALIDVANEDLPVARCITLYAEDAGVQVSTREVSSVRQGLIPDARLPAPRQAVSFSRGSSSGLGRVGCAIGNVGVPRFFLVREGSLRTSAHALRITGHGAGVFGGIIAGLRGALIT